MQIHKFTYPNSVLDALPKEQLSAFLLLGLFLNEANWLQKLLLISTLDETGNEAEKQARLALSLMLSKLLAAKIHEGWNRIRCNPLKDALPSNDKTQQIRSQLEQRLAKDSVIHKVRAQHAFHYPNTLSLNGLPAISQSDVALFMTHHSGDTLSLISELSAAAGLMAIGNASTVAEALDGVLKEVVAVAGIYCEYLSETLANFVGEVIQSSAAADVIDNDDAPTLDLVRLRFFAAPPASSAIKN